MKIKTAPQDEPIYCCLCDKRLKKVVWLEETEDGFSFLPGEVPPDKKSYGMNPYGVDCAKIALE